MLRIRDLHGRPHACMLADADQFTTRNGRPAAVLIGYQDLEALEETLDILSDPDARAITAALGSSPLHHRRGAGGELDRRPQERGQVVRPSRGDEVAVDDYFGILPLGSRVAQIISDRRG